MSHPATLRIRGLNYTKNIILPTLYDTVVKGVLFYIILIFFYMFLILVMYRNVKHFPRQSAICGNALANRFVAGLCFHVQCNKREVMYESSCHPF